MNETRALQLLGRISTRKSVVRKIDGTWWVFTKSFGFPRVVGYNSHTEAMRVAHELARY